MGEIGVNASNQFTEDLGAKHKKTKTVVKSLMKSQRIKRLKAVPQISLLRNKDPNKGTATISREVWEVQLF
jgi:hypothetical protein